jgi:prepilin-type N-terminal cleavage/methylation domain-containing protein
MNTEPQVSKREAFTLLEMLVAMAVVALMMAFMFNMVAQAIRTWEIGGRKMEGAQAARIGMNYLAQELQFAMAGVRTSRGNPTPDIVNTIPFVALANAQSLPGNATAANLEAPNGSDQLFFVAPVSAWSSDTGGPQWLSPFGEIGYMTLFVKSTGFSTMTGQRYYLVRHGGRAGVLRNDQTRDPFDNPELRDFYLRGGAVATASSLTNWITNGVQTYNRVSLVDNCIQFKLEYASNNNGTIDWSTNWPSRTNLPLGVLVTMRVLDAKSANRIAAMRVDNKLTAQQLESLTNGQPSSDPIVGILREGTTTLRRFVPLLQSTAP